MAFPDWLDPEGVGKWFDSKNYRPSRDPKYWANMIYARVKYLEYLQDHIEVPEFRAMGFRDMVIGSFADPLKDHYFPESVAVQELDFIAYLDLMDVLSNSEEFAKHSSEFVENESFIDRFGYTRSEYKQLKETGELKRLKPTNELQDRIHQGIRSRHKPVSEFSDVASSSNVHVVVDSAQDDETLVEEFLEFLHAKRGIKKRKINEINFDNWYTAGVLPCFDLMAWSALFGQTPTNVQLGEWIWPEANFDRAERIRKTTKPHLNKVFTRSTLKRVGSLTDWMRE